MFYVVDNDWTGMSPIVPVLPSSFGGSRVFVVSYVVVASLFVLMASSISGIDYGGVTYMCVPLCNRVFWFVVVLDFHFCPLL